MSHEAKDIVKPLSSHWYNKLLLAIAGILIPIICLLLNIKFATIDTDNLWQSGESETYMRLLLYGDPVYFFYPFILYSVFCLLFLLVKPSYFAKLFIIRLGIYTGIIVSLQFTILMIVIHDIDKYFLLGVFYIIIILILLKVLIRLNKWIVWLVVGGVFLISIIVYLFYAESRFWHETIGLPLIISVLLGAPIWSLLTYSWATVQLFRIKSPEKDNKLGKGLLSLTWFSVHMIMWRLAIAKMLEIYASLPKTPPNDCYICNAAATGHSWLVKSKTVIYDSNILRVNDQMRWFKIFELVIMKTIPKSHMILRKTYNMIGPLIAKALIHPILADIVYLALKPIEWILMICLKLLIPEVDKLSADLY